jgi:hypothetical protein
MKKSFNIPMLATFNVYKERDRYVAHSLDFDLVCVSDREDRALENLRLAVKSYIEYGLEKGWREQILFPAPKPYWDSISPNAVTRIMPPIEIDHQSMIIMTAETAMPPKRANLAYEARIAACQA